MKYITVITQITRTSMGQEVHATEIIQVNMVHLFWH